MANNTNAVRPTNKYEGIVNFLSIIVTVGAFCMGIGMGTTKRVEYTNQCPIEKGKSNTIYMCEIVSLQLDTNSNINKLYKVKTLDGKEISVLDNTDKLVPFKDDNVEEHLATLKNITLKLTAEPRLGTYTVNGAEVSKTNKDVGETYRMPLYISEDVKKGEVLPYPQDTKVPTDLKAGNYVLVYRFVNGEPEPLYMENMDMNKDDDKRISKFHN
jgi:hypothetical protein